jgi:signal transduction histidine kinase
MKVSVDHEVQLEVILQAIADAVLVVDADGVVRYANAAAERIFDRPSVEIVGQSFGLPIVSGDTTEVEIVPADGNVTTGELRTVELSWHDQPAYAVSLRDITDRRRAAEHAQQLMREQLARAQAEESERNARFLVDAANALGGSLDYPVTLSELARVCTQYNADWCVIDVVEIDGELKRLAVAQRDPAQAQLAHELAQISAELHPLPCEPEVLRSGEPMLLDSIETVDRDPHYRELLTQIAPRSAMLVPLLSRKKPLGVIALISSASGFNYSASDLSIAAEVGRNAAAAIDNCRLYEEAQRGNEAKSNFLAVMSHELHTPLNAVLGYADLLTMGVPVPIPELAKVHVDRIRSSAQHLLRLIEQILTFSNLEGERTEIDVTPVAITQIAQDLADTIAPMARDKHLEFKVQLPEQDYVIATDVGKLQQILLNLLSNAVKFTSAGKVELNVVPVDGWTHFEVRDSGIGIESEHLNRIFEPFWQAEQSRTRRTEGIGLGLSVAHRLAQMLGGSLVVQSAVKQGSTFTLLLPNHPGA